MAIWASHWGGKEMNTSLARSSGPMAWRSASRCPGGRMHAIGPSKTHSGRTAGWVTASCRKPTSARWPATKSMTVEATCWGMATSMPPWASKKAATIRGRNPRARAGLQAMRSAPRRMVRIWSTAPAIRSRPRKDCSTSSNSPRASRVGDSRPWRRSNRISPVEDSKSPIKRLMAGWEILSVLAARVTVWRCIGARKASICLNVIVCMGPAAITSEHGHRKH